MPAYVLVDVEVLKPNVYQEYREKAPAIVAHHGGRYVVRGGAQHHLEPGFDLHRTVILEFPSTEAAHKWYHSRDYQRILPIRLKSTNSRMVVLDGLDHGAAPP